MSNAYEKGRQAAKSGQIKASNPYLSPGGRGPAKRSQYEYDQWLEGFERGMKEISNSFQNGCERAEKEIQNKLQNAGMKVENKIDDESMKAKGYRYKIELPPGMGEPLYTKDFNAAKEMAKEYGAGTKVTELR